MKKIVAIALSIVLALGALTACGQKPVSQQTPAELGASAAKELTITLTDEEMQKSIEEYVVVLNGALAENDCEAQLAVTDKGVAINIVQGEDDQLTQELMAFKNMKDTFAYLLYTGQVDEQGKVLAQPVMAGSPPAESETAGDATSKTTPEAVSEAPTANAESGTTSELPPASSMPAAENAENSVDAAR